MSTCSESAASVYQAASSAASQTTGRSQAYGPGHKQTLDRLKNKDKAHFECSIKDYNLDKFGKPESRSRTVYNCVVYYYKQFAALRQLYCAGDDLKIIRSLCRCNSFSPSGGKSGSAFAKTKDNRFMLKNISKVELGLFLQVAHRYFNYMADTIDRRLPTVLVKILGVFKITNKSTQSTHTYVLMEDLFYNHKISKVYDLKGSMRNRFQSNQNATLLDENLIRQLTDSGMLFTKEEHKDLFNMSIHNDTLLLTQLNVMDYSLLVGIDEEARTLVVGIIDYVREYTIDKQMEYLVKSSGMMGGGKMAPTVIQPRMYKQRFRHAMKNYFLILPSKETPWIVLRNGLKTVMDSQLREFLHNATFNFFAPRQKHIRTTSAARPGPLFPSDNISTFFEPVLLCHYCTMPVPSHDHCVTPTTISLAAAAPVTIAISIRRPLPPMPFTSATTTATLTSIP
eukprot:CAMPEP_0174372070 /NCGR_PEP_ID=MMETSP0811_2-20130205/102188_1 /TAXON_ID=73025 ORGANISM="Eutreptiella gymnastica-like, Strain CCMP1594" /NCGR_SAMPLE_ID=MMETSP0811_2 /ASSEMBLY_ACC=CAM_ASM_000667 /LENGTH=452 /DNA_ID=CAMNT_0015519099 /DNA_START=124 /DNA_END=1479 /DNA_ORIENTATION=+